MTLNCAVVPMVAVWLTGCVAILGATTTGVVVVAVACDDAAEVPTESTASIM